MSKHTVRDWTYLHGSPHPLSLWGSVRLFVCKSCGWLGIKTGMQSDLLLFALLCSRRDREGGTETKNRSPASAQIAVASRPRLSPNSMASRHGSHTLRSGISASNSTPNPVVTALAGFALFAFAFPLGERFSGLGLAVPSTGPALDPVVTSMAGFAGARRPHATGGRTKTPGAFS
jgi:hypothetical protein